MAQVVEMATEAPLGNKLHRLHLKRVADFKAVALAALFPVSIDGTVNQFNGTSLSKALEVHLIIR